MYAEIIIPLALPKNYTWAIPEAMQAEIMEGMRVEVMLGANKRYAGIVKKITLAQPAGFTPKPILSYQPKICASSPLVCLPRAY